LSLLAPVEAGTLVSQDMARFGTGLARLLLGPSVREGLETMADRPLVVVHDREASRVPWEALRIGNRHPALAQGVSRRYESEALTVARWRDNRAPDHRLNVLLVANPTGDLPGAAAEARALRGLFGTSHVACDVLEGSTARRTRILEALATGRHDVLHFAGHGYFDADDPGRSGLICAGGNVLCGADLDGLGNLPALVFFNACEAARVRLRAASRRAARALFGERRSSSVAEAFLAGGVANFLGTHWPVGDAAALEFSTHMYQRLVAGAPLGTAVLAARQRVLGLDSIDWADYVHYGNPTFTLAG
jgi:CHAT domain-containing protein